MGCVLACVCPVVAGSGVSARLPLMMRGQPSFNELEMMVFAELAGASYCPQSDIQDWSCGPCIDSGLAVSDVKFVAQDDLGTENSSFVVVAKLALHPGCLISFRGSHDIANWLRDAEIWGSVVAETVSVCPGCEIHSGFYTIWTNIQDHLKQTLLDVGCSPSGLENNLYITGHSLGAALAHIAMFALADVGYDIMQSYTFESPRVGNGAFRDAFTNKFNRSIPVWRITHQKDPIVHLPSTFVCGYEHVMSEVFYYYDEDWEEVVYKTCDDRDGEDPTCSASETSWDVNDHCHVPFVIGGDICSCATSRAAGRSETLVTV